MFVPTEVLLEILQHLEKIDLKTVRLVSRSFGRYAAGFLFDTVYISAHKVDFDVLSNIVDHPQLSRCVKKLKYDASQFPTLSKECYASELLPQLMGVKRFPGALLNDSLDLDFNGLVEILSDGSDGRFHEANRQEAWNRYSNSSFIQEGYEKFLQHADRLEAAKNDQEYWKAVVGKLGYFISIESAEMYSYWYHPRVDISLRTGSPLNRSWNPIHLFPVYFSYREAWDSPPISSDGLAEFVTFNRLLQGLPRRMKSLETDRTHIPIASFGDEALTSSLLNGFRDYDQLRSLSLCIQDRHFLVDDRLIAMPSLPKLLRATTQLRRLKLNLPGKTATQGLYYTVREIFLSGQNITWPYLESLNINNIATDASRWIALLVFSLPNLRSLILLNIELDDFHWPVVIESMHHSLSLSEFRIRRGPGLRNADHTVLSTQDTPHVTANEWGTEDHHKFLDKIEHYVIQGGRNPFLRTDQPDHALVEASTKLYASARRIWYRMMSDGSRLRSEML